MYNKIQTSQKGDYDMSKTAIYVRVSSKGQVEGTSLDDQEKECRDKALELGVPSSEIVLFREAGASGESIERPEMDSLREDVSNGIIKRVIVYSPDRFSRELNDKLLVCSEFESKGVELHFCDTDYADTPEGQLFFNMKSVIAQYELSLIRKRTKRGSIGAAKKGQYMPTRTPTYGYDHLDGHLVINDEEAKFVMKMYEMYVYERYSIRQIAEKLIEMGAKPKKGVNWSHSTIQKILANETYIGKFYYNRTQVEKVKGKRTEAGNQKVVKKKREEKDWIIIPVPPIISQELYSKAYERRQKNKEMTGKQKYDYLLRNKIRCGHCGSKYSSFVIKVKNKAKENTKGGKEVYEYRKYGCCKRRAVSYGANGTDNKCTTPAINADLIENFLWNEILILFEDKDKLQQSLTSERTEIDEAIIKTHSQLKKKLDDKLKEKDRVLSLFKKGFIEEDEMEKDLTTIQKQLKAIQFEFNNYEQKIQSKNQQEFDAQQLEEVASKIIIQMRSNEELSHELKQRTIDMFVDDIIITYDDLTKKKDKRMTINFTGIINESFYDISPHELGRVDKEHKNKYLNVSIETLVTHGFRREISLLALETSVNFS